MKIGMPEPHPSVEEFRKKHPELSPPAMEMHSIESMPPPVSPDLAASIWLALAHKEREGQAPLTEDERDLYQMLTGRLKYDVAIVGLEVHTTP